jgi:chemotaxis protein methyltransferase CheR
MENHMSLQEFRLFQSFMQKATGIYMNESKIPLVSGRLSKRLRERHVDTYKEYYQLLVKAEESCERQMAIDLLTTNETSFFREKNHFQFLQNTVLPRMSGQSGIRIWSAASSTGEEAYSLAMLMAEVRGLHDDWEIFGSDISSRVVEQARSALYPLERARNIPEDYLRRYCLRGKNEYSEKFLINKKLRSHVSFDQVNLSKSISGLPKFHIIFLRNILIYFNAEGKREIVERVADQLMPDGFLIVGHSESLHDLHPGLFTVQPTVYQWRKSN